MPAEGMLGYDGPPSPPGRCIAGCCRGVRLGLPADIQRSHGRVTWCPGALVGWQAIEAEDMEI